MSERTLNKIEEVKGIDLNYVDRITFYSHYDENGRDYETTASMAFWNETYCKWGAEIAEWDKIPKRGPKVLNEAGVRYRLKKMGIKPAKIKWSMSTPTDLEDCLLHISSRYPSFSYTEQHVVNSGSDEAIVFVGITVEYDTVEQQYTVIRRTLITGDPEAVRDAFVKGVSQAITGDTPAKIKVYEFDEEEREAINEESELA